jgi:hypothetical protein
LRYRAARQLAALLKAAGQYSRAGAFERDAEQIKQAIPRTFFHPTLEPGEGWLHSATEVGNQPDIWGSAFAIWSGAVEGETANAVSRALVRAFRERTAVRNGWVRHILSSDPMNKGGWEISISRVGEYQNGGYWGTPVGWYLAAIDRIDRQAAVDMAQDYMNFLREHLRTDGTTEAWEWFNPETGKRANPLYVASVVLPYLSLKEAGLLREESKHSLAGAK